MPFIGITSVTSAPARSSNLDTQVVNLRDLGRADYARVWQDMRAFTDRRDVSTRDEIWLVEHPPVYTLGTNDRDEAFDNPGIPVVKSDRGGQITYHGPGQLITYVLMDLRRRGWGIKQLVKALEQAVIELLAARGIPAVRHAGMPGVYVDGRKIAQLGLRVRRGACYHGLSFNVDMDHTPFRHIKPCGYAGLETTDLATLAGREHAHLNEVKPDLLVQLLRNLGYHEYQGS
jgi:lipoyl(octanoyl) transferase